MAATISADGSAEKVIVNWHSIVDMIGWQSMEAGAINVLRNEALLGMYYKEAQNVFETGLHA
jgi:hypothetical protein